MLALLVPIWGLVVGLLALKQHEKRRALGFMVPSAVMIMFLLAVKLSGLPNNPAVVGYDIVGGTPINAAPTDPVEQELLAAANNVTSIAPRMIDADTRLDGAFVGPQRTFTYLYTLPKVLSLMPPGEFDKKLAPNIKRAGCASKQLQPFFEHDVVVTYKYRANDGTELGSVQMSKKLCPRKVAAPKAAPASAPVASAPAAEPAPPAPPEPTQLPESLAPSAAPPAPPEQPAQ